jgi:hypothetical protein
VIWIYRRALHKAVPDAHAPDNRHV